MCVYAWMLAYFCVRAYTHAHACMLVYERMHLHACECICVHAMCDCICACVRAGVHFMQNSHFPARRSDCIITVKKNRSPKKCIIGSRACTSKGLKKNLCTRHLICSSVKSESIFSVKPFPRRFSDQQGCVDDEDVNRVCARETRMRHRVCARKTRTCERETKKKISGRRHLTCSGVRSGGIFSVKQSSSMSSAPTTLMAFAVTCVRESAFKAPTTHACTCVEAFAQCTS